MGAIEQFVVQQVCIRWFDLDSVAVAHERAIVVSVGRRPSADRRRIEPDCRRIVQVFHGDGGGRRV